MGCSRGCLDAEDVAVAAANVAIVAVAEEAAEILTGTNVKTKIAVAINVMTLGIAVAIKILTAAAKTVKNLKAGALKESIANV